MGNVEQETQKQAQPANANKLGMHKYMLQIRDRQIILSYRDKIKITIGDVLSFPAGGFEGLHLWDSNVILARYLLLNRDVFAGKSVLQLLSGTGLAAITAKKFTSAQSITATDRCSQTVSNIHKNCSKNNIDDIQVACITWAEYSKQENKGKFNFIIGADLLFKGCPVQLLLCMFDKFLAVGGKAIIVVPFNSGNDSSAELVSKLDSQKWTLKKEKLTDEIYMESPLLNQVQGYEEFKQISEGQFYVYILQKTKEIEKQNVQTKQIEQTIRTVRYKKEQKTQSKWQQEIKIKEQNIEQKDAKKELQVVKVSKTEDRPQYQRKKRKTITQIIAQSEELKPVKESKNINSAEEQSKEDVKKQHQFQGQLPNQSHEEKKPNSEDGKQGLNNVGNSPN